MQSSDEVVQALRRHLMVELAQTSLAHAARALAMSTRSLQRQLAAAGTSLRLELERARFERARAQLVASDVKLEALALELGFASPSHFASRFRRAVGETPSQYRARHRAVGA